MGNNRASRRGATGNSTDTVERSVLDQSDMARFSEADDLDDDDLVVVGSDDGDIEVALASDVEEKVPDIESADSETIEGVVAAEGVDTFTLEGVGDDAETGDRVEEVGAGDLAAAVRAIDYDGIVADQTGRDGTSTGAKIANELERLDTEELPASETTRLEAIVQDVDAYDSVEDVVRDARKAWQEHHHETALRREQFDDDAKHKSDKFFGERYAALDGDLSDKEKIVLSDSSDADGGTCMMLYEEAYGDDALVIPGGGDPDRSFAEIMEKAPEGTTVAVADLNPRDDQQWLDAIEEHGDGISIEVRDHHEWNRETLKKVLAHNLSEGHSKDEVRKMVDVDTSAPAAAGLVYENDTSKRDLTSGYDGVSDEEYRENIEATVEATKAADTLDRSHDRWNEAKYLRAYQYERPPQEYAEMTAKHGPAFVGKTKQGRAFAEASLIDDLQTSIAIGETAITTSREVDGGEVEVGIVHGGGGDGSVIAGELQERGVDFVAVTKSTVNSGGGEGEFTTTLNLRATEDAPVAEAVTDRIDGDGGGRETTAGMGDIPIGEFYDSDTLSGIRDEHANKNGQGAMQKVGSQLPDAVEQAMEERED